MKTTLAFFLLVCSIFGQSGLDTGVRIQSGAYSNTNKTSKVTINPDTQVNTGTLVVSNVTASLPAKFDSGKKITSGAIDLSGSEATGTIADARLANSGVTAGTYGNASYIPQVTVDAKGRITGISTNAVSAGTSVYANGSSVSNPNFKDSSTATVTIGSVTNITVNPTNIANAQIAAAAGIVDSKLALSSAITVTTTNVAIKGVTTGTAFVSTNDFTSGSTNIISALAGKLTGPVDLGSANASGTLAAGRFPALTGAVTTTAGSVATTLSTNQSQQKTWVRIGTTNLGVFSSVTLWPGANISMTSTNGTGNTNVDVSFAGAASGSGAPNGTMVSSGTSISGAIPKASDTTGTNYTPTSVTIDTTNVFAGAFIATNSISVGAGTSAGQLQLNDVDASNGYFLQATNAMTTNIVETLPVAPYNGILYWTVVNGTNALRNATNITGDVTTDGALVSTIGAQKVTYSKLQNLTATQRVLGRNTAGAGSAEEVTFTQFLDWVGSAAQGDILFRGDSAWSRLGAGTSNQVLTTQGATQNPIWSTPAGGGNVSGSGTSIANALPIYADTSGTAITPSKIGTSSLTNLLTGGLVVSNSAAQITVNGNVMTFPSSSATLARTDAGNTFTGNQTSTGTLTAQTTGSILPDAVVTNFVRFKFVSLAYSAATNLTMDLNAGSVFYATLTNTTFIAVPSNIPADAQTIILHLKQDATGGRAVTFAGNFKFSGGTPTITTNASAHDILTMVRSPYVSTNLDVVAVQNLQ